MAGFDWLLIATLLGNVVGWFLKNKTDLTNKIIPYVQIGLAAIKNFAVAAGLLPAAATVAGTSVALLGVPVSGIALAGIGGFGWFILSTLLDAALPVGLHSIMKNAKQLQTGVAAKAKR